ncbi:hypothetical protein I6A60_34925 [Frankia sp. AgB1.9]|nr:hypothetical protein [Frankia sp. AgW1.1]MBL7553008.1 hypothetical protein [Frankia sp. AgB1.9]MBL7621600.1 hypothetical protein [Frankia sp. AgB1.8]
MLRRVCVVPAAPDAVWARMTSPEGINDELMPVMRMSVPVGLRGKTIDDVPLGERVCRSWLLLFGFVPFEYDDIVIAEREPGRRFRETSTMWSVRRWVHERTVAPHVDGSIVEDQITFRLRCPVGAVPGSHRLLGAVLTLLFAHRHRRLRRHFARSAPAVELPGDAL